ncbi:HEPN domain-containing protein [Maricaulis parjimensis]|uniref:HEPN domain-containing protein n=1 Tax=Maricaulis parjimensis TaxID=144023 RepID=UPI00193A20A1
MPTSYGARGIGERDIARFLLWTMGPDGDLDAAVEKFEQTIDGESLRFVVVVPLMRMELLQSRQLSNGVFAAATISDVRDLPASLLSLMSDTIPGLSADDTAALVFETRLAPVFTETGPGLPQSWLGEVARVKSEIDEVVRVIALSRNTGIRKLPYFTYTDFGPDLGYSPTGNEAYHHIMPELFSIEPVAERIDKLIALPTKTRELLSRILERYHRSLLDRDDVDRSINLTIALESLFIGDNSSEISHRIAERASWLLGEDVEKRLEIFGVMKAIYGARSTAAHQGKLKRGFDVGLLDQAADIFVRAVDKILTLQSRPNEDAWKRIVLGGEFK